MDTSKVFSLLEQLDDEIDDLEEAMSSLTKAPLSEFASKLPLLDKAKLYVLVTYAIESVLFSYLRLHGVKAREHPVFTELTRVKQYFEKIKVAENPINQSATKRENLSLDKKAAERIIKASFAGNDTYDLQRAEQQAKERARAHIKFAELSEKMKLDELSKKRKAEKEIGGEEEDSDPSDSESDEEYSSEVIEEAPAPKKHEKKIGPRKKSRKNKVLEDGSGPGSAVSSASEKSKREERKQRKKERRDKIEKKNKDKKVKS